MRMRLLSPFRCHLNIENSRVLHHEEAYGRNWEAIRDAVRPDIEAIAPGTTVEFLHAGLAPMAMRFQNLSVDGSLFPPEVLRVAPPVGATIVAGGRGRGRGGAGRREVRRDRPAPRRRRSSSASSTTRSRSPS